VELRIREAFPCENHRQLRDLLLCTVRAARAVDLSSEALGRSLGGLLREGTSGANSGRLSSALNESSRVLLEMSGRFAETATQLDALGA
jgi:hypothetical protein